MKIYTIIVTYNGSKWIDKCFGSLTKSNIPLKILAIDNASTDNTPLFIKEKFPQVEVIETGQNLGFGKANNIGLEIAAKNNANFVFLLNQDAWIEPATIEKLVNVSIQHPEFGIISPLQLNGSNDYFEQSFKKYLGENNTSGFLSDLYFDRLKDIYQTNYTNAASWLITAECLKRVGGFNPLFFHYGEDDEYLNRCKYKGLKIGIAPSTSITHDTIFKEINPNNLYNNQKAENTIKGRLLNLKNNIPAKHYLIREIIINTIKSLLLHFKIDEFTRKKNKGLWYSFKMLDAIKKSRAIILKNNYPYLNIER
jgi:GT2 family glycosyltransferase